MPQPLITGNPAILKFGGLALPNGQGVLSQIDLDDEASWHWMDFSGDDDFVVHTVGRLAWRARGAFIGQDFGERTLTLPMRYREVSSPVGAALARLSQAGAQNLTFDNVTAILVKYAGTRSRKLLNTSAPSLWEFDLQFLAPTPWFFDLSATTYMNAVALNSGSVTNTNVTYAGSVFAEPVFTLNIPNTNTAPIASLRLQNTMSGDDITVAFPGSLAGSTTWAITVDAGALSVTDNLGRAYDVSAGAFPLFYGPAGQVQQISATLTPASGTATSCTLTAVATNRWLL